MPRIPLSAALAAVAGLASVADAQTPTVDEQLARKPIFAGVKISTPTGADLAACRAQTANFAKPATGTQLLDGQGRLVRQLIDSKGVGRPNMAYFYFNGVESYRETDYDGNGTPDQFRWLGVNGGKWGGASNEDGVIDVWYDLSPAELTQELFAALQSRDPKRLAPLVVTAADLKALQLPDSEAQKILGAAANLQKRFDSTAAALALQPEARWIHAEVGIPNVVAGDSLGGADLTRIPAVTVLYEKGDRKSADLFQTGELIQINRVWKLIDGPAPGAAQANPDMGGVNPVVVPEAVRGVVAELQALTAPQSLAQMPAYHAQRAALLEKVVAATSGEQQQPWLRQVVDAYTAAAASGDAAGMARLKQWADKIAADAPNSPAAAYAAFRLLDAQYTAQMSAATPAKAAEIQKWWREQLEGFVKNYPTADDAPEAMMRLAVASEFASGGEADAKKWYEKLTQAYPADPRALKANGAMKRLQSEGQPLTLPSATTIDGKPFDPASLAGQPVLLYYFANWSNDPSAEARVIDELKKLGEAAKNATVVTVSLDDTPARGNAAIQAAGLKGIHLHAAGGLDRSPLAAAYGIQMVPHLMLIGKDGKVANRNAQAGPGLAAEVEKLAK